MSSAQQQSNLRNTPDSSKEMSFPALSGTGRTSQNAHLVQDSPDILGDLPSHTGAGARVTAPASSPPHGGKTMPDFRPAREGTSHSLPHYPWQDEVHDALRRTYALRGWSRQVYINDWALLRRMCGPKHPRELEVADLERVILRAKSSGTRHVYVARIKSIMRTLRKLGIVAPSFYIEEELPKVRRPRGVPRPLTDAEVQTLVTQAGSFDSGPGHNQRIDLRHWFILGAYAGLRAMEVAKIEGNWLEYGSDGPTLRVQGKGGTDMVIPAHPKVVEVIEFYQTLGRLWDFDSGNKISTRATREMRRLGIERPKTFHSCRHYFATKALEISGGDLKVTSELCRHLSLNTTAGYAATISGKKRSVVEAFAFPTSGVGIAPEKIVA